MRFALISAGPNASKLTYLAFYSLAALIGLAMVGLLVKGGPTIVFVAFTLLLAIFLGIPIHERVVQARIKRGLKILKATIVGLENGDRLRFSKPLRLRPIVFEVESRKLWLSGPHYSWSAWVVPRGAYEAKNVHVFGDLSYGIMVDRGGEGGAILPGIEFDEDKMRHIVLLYIPSRQPRVEAAHHTLKSPWGQLVDVTVYEGLGLRGEARLSGGGRASIYLVAELPGSPHRVKLKLADLRSGGAVELSARLAPESPVLVVAHKRSSPRGLARHLTKPLIAGDALRYSLTVVFRRGILRKSVGRVELRIVR